MEEAKAIRTLILDTNVPISSLAKSEGITRASLTILLHDENCKVLAPADVVEELRKHTQDICNKAGITRPLLEDALDRLLENIDLAPVSVYENELHEALRFVRDDSDAPFAALALMRSPSTIMTYNKRHFNSRLLWGGGGGGGGECAIVSSYIMLRARYFMYLGTLQIVDFPQDFYASKSRLLIMSKGLVAKASISVNAPISKVWDSLVNPALIKQYMFGTNVVSDWKEGSPIVWKGEWQGNTYEDKGVILKLDPQRQI